VIGVARELSAAFAERMVAPSHNLVPLPDGIPAELGSLVEPLAVGLHAAGRAEITAADVVLVIGGGPIGQAAALAARRLGARAIQVAEPEPQRRDLVSRLGFATTAGPVDGPPADVVIDAVGTAQTLQTAFDVSTLGARIVLVGMGAPRVEVNAYAISTEERTVLGSFSYSEAEFRDTAEWVGAHAADLGVLVDARVNLDDAPEMFRALAAKELAASKVLVYPSGI
jgi:threonine dehydrogenase-like Zn-dependent dehydrogenase